ncbi:hypothetical protein B0H13DRAFT_1874999 [Mycena leptocephala]|nr:hypothetical protein B0H13DRAFT_1874999 [Mycena leptocephala]
MSVRSNALGCDFGARNDSRARRRRLGNPDNWLYVEFGETGQERQALVGHMREGQESETCGTRRTPCLAPATQTSQADISRVKTWPIFRTLRAVCCYVTGEPRNHPSLDRIQKGLDLAVPRSPKKNSVERNDSQSGKGAPSVAVSDEHRNGREIDGIKYGLQSLCSDFMARLRAPRASYHDGDEPTRQVFSRHSIEVFVHVLVAVLHERTSILTDTTMI